jgi:hypothetical protein
MDSDEITGPENINNIHNYQEIKILQSLYRSSNKITLFIGD